MPDPGSSPETPFADLVSRYLDGTADAAESGALSRALLEDAERGREFASQARFESMLRKACRRDAKALFEFAALEAASDDSADMVVAAPAALPLPQQRPIRWRTAAIAPWLRVAAVFLVLATSVALWFNREQQVKSAPQVAGATPITVQVQSVTDDQMVLLAPRQQIEATGIKTPNAAPETKVLTLAERLEDFYLPAVHLHKVRAQDAADWLTAQLRQHNYAKRPDLNRLTLRLPSAVASRLVTLESGPISFKKAVEIVAMLASSQASVTDDGIQIVDLVPLNLPVPNGWQPSPWDQKETERHAAALGIPLDKTRQDVDATGVVRLRLAEEEQRALHTFAEAQKQLESLAPLSFVPLIVPPGAAGTERVLSASAIDSIRQQLAASPNAGSLPTVTIPFGNGSQGASLINGSGDTAITLKVTPVGEMNQVTIQPTTTPPVTPTTNLVADNSPAAPPASVDAVLDTNQGVVTTIPGDGSTQQLYTAEGIPIPPGYEFLFGFFAAPPDDGSGSTLVLVPVP